MRPSIRDLACVITLVVTSACASAKDEAPAPTPVKEVVSGGARLRGGSLRMDVQVGRPMVQRPTTNAKVTATSNAVVTP